MTQRTRTLRWGLLGLSVGVAAMLAGACGRDPAGPRIETTATGLQYVDFVVGNGTLAALGDTATVDYTARQMDGTAFDSTIGMQPLRFVIGTRNVIAGFDEGVSSMRVGGQRRLIIPAGLAWGDRGHLPFVPPGGSVIFDVDLLRISRPGPV